MATLSTIFEEPASEPGESYIMRRLLLKFIVCDSSIVNGYAQCYEAANLFLIYFLARQEIPSSTTMHSVRSSTPTLVSDQHISGSTGLPPPHIRSAQIREQSSSSTVSLRDAFEVPPSKDNEEYVYHYSLRTCRRSPNSGGVLQKCQVIDHIPRCSQTTPLSLSPPSLLGL